MRCVFQVFHVAYVFIKMANSPRPGVWALERSSDFGATYQPWQYFADSLSDCYQFFGDEAGGFVQTIERDDSVICTTRYSSVVPLEDGEVSVDDRTRRLRHLHDALLQRRATRGRRGECACVQAAADVYSLTSL